MNRYHLAGLLLWPIAATVSAQNLTTEQQLTIRSHLCFHQCLDTRTEIEIAYQEEIDRERDFISRIASPRNANEQAQLDELIEQSREQICANLQNIVRVTETCELGCTEYVDTYAGGATGSINSVFQERFGWIVEADKTPLRDVGLWTDFASSPLIGSSEFSTACRALFDYGQPDQEDPQSWLDLNQLERRQQ